MFIYEIFVVASHRIHLRTTDLKCTVILVSYILRSAVRAKLNSC